MVKLVEVLKNKNEDLLNKLEDIKNITKPLLGRTIASFLNTQYIVLNILRKLLRNWT